MPALKQSFNDVGYTCLRHTFEFLPKDFEWRLYYRLIRAGAVFFRIKKPHIHGIPLAIQQRPIKEKQAIEVNIAHVLIEESLKGSLVFYAALTEEISNLLSAEERELYNYDKIELLFELLQSWPEAPFYGQLSVYYEDWKNVAQLLLDGNADKEEYLASCRKALKNTQELLNPLPSDQVLLPPDRLAGKVAEAILRIVVTEGLTSYPYELTWESKTLLIPPHATPEMLPVEGGTFRMGSEEYDDEKPVHEVALNSFEIGKFPVTMQEFDAFCEATKREKPNDRGWGRENRPAIYADWYDAIEYCNWLSGIWELEPVYQIEKDKKDNNNMSSFDKKKWLVTPNWQANGYRLPTEAEWEYAARGGKHSEGYQYAGSNELDEVGWYSGNSDSKTHPVGQKKSNGLGLHDMSGNAWEWCWDWYGSYPSAPQDKPTGPDSGSVRVYRGGSLLSSAAYARCSYRSGSTPDLRSHYLGFRLARAGGQ
ncbi:MAG: formylglycine-generating enzyme family protein [Phaeodactylibacter sp.]|nr:formylglycine-generating enzyme family protein [Phaeodactylibacter sp.]